MAFTRSLSSFKSIGVETEKDSDKSAGDISADTIKGSMRRCSCSNRSWLIVSGR